MNNDTDVILERLQKLHPVKIDLSLDRVKRLLAKLGNPEKNLPPAVHVAGTNGKGSTIAFMRAILETGGHTVHAYTSPHLVKFNERIRIGGKLLSDKLLDELLTEVEKINGDDPITFFEITTCVAFLAFSRFPADILLLETGLGGRLDATNVIEKPALSILTPISSDHNEYLGDTIEKIAWEKAHIIKQETPCLVAEQPNEAMQVIQEMAAKIQNILKLSCKAPIGNWDVIPTDKGFIYKTKEHELPLPAPALPGRHQIDNAGLAIAAVENLYKRSIISFTKKSFAQSVTEGMQTVEWAGRMQQISSGKLHEMLPMGWELWLDGGHNEAAGEVIADTLNHMHKDKHLHIIVGMLNTKNASAYLQHIATCADSICAVTVPYNNIGIEAKELARLAAQTGESEISIAEDYIAAIKKAVDTYQNENRKVKILICGSLYLLGEVLQNN